MKKNKKLSSEEILHLAKLSNLILTDEEIEKFKIQLSHVLDYINKLNELNTDNIEPVSHVTGSTNIFSEDKTNSIRRLTQAEALKNTKAKKDGFFRVKSIFAY